MITKAGLDNIKFSVDETKLKRQRYNKTFSGIHSFGKSFWLSSGIEELTIVWGKKRCLCLYTSCLTARPSLTEGNDDLFKTEQESRLVLNNCLTLQRQI